ncbi:hypothetical protein CsSME_00036068 [Camellia sinensis var. sinensis]
MLLLNSAPFELALAREWVVDHKLRCLWLSSIASSIAYNWSQSDMKTSVQIIHARYNFA